MAKPLIVKLADVILIGFGILVALELVVYGGCYLLYLAHGGQ